VNYCRLDRVERLLELGSPLEARVEGKTTLFRAIWTCPAAIPLLVAAGADVHATDQNGSTPLSHAAGIAEDGLAVTYLVEAGSDLEVRDNNGGTPLSYAVAGGMLRNVEILLEAGSDPLAVVFDDEVTILEFAKQRASEKGYGWQDRMKIAELVEQAAAARSDR
jgi:ankyrin repeat protein